MDKKSLISVGATVVVLVMVGAMIIITMYVPKQEHEDLQAAQPATEQ